MAIARSYNYQPGLQPGLHALRNEQAIPNQRSSVSRDHHESMLRPILPDSALKESQLKSARGLTEGARLMSEMERNNPSIENCASQNAPELGVPGWLSADSPDLGELLHC